MPKIVMINTVCSGSHGRIVKDLRVAAQGGGFDTVVAFGRGAPMQAEDIRIGTAKDVLLHVARTRLGDGHARGSRRATQAFVEKLSAIAPDIVHLHNVHGYYLHAETLFAYLRVHRIPTLWTLHDCWALTGHCSHFVRANCERLYTGCYACPLRKEYPSSLLLDHSKKNWLWKREAFSGMQNLTVVSPSIWLDSIIARSYVQDAPRKVIPNGVDISLFRPGRDASVRARFGVADGQILLLAVASPFDARKGFDDMIALSKRLLGIAQIVMVGLSPKQLRVLPPNVHGMPRTDGPEALVKLYGVADCLVNPTYEDTYPTVNMEAIACGTPVAAYAVGGCVEQIAEGVGRAVPCGDVDALASAARELAAQKDARGAMCRAHAEKYFNRGNAMEAYVANYKQMIGM